MTITKIKGFALAAIAAAAYGTNPAFAIPLYEQGMNPNSVLLFRYILGLPLLAIMMLVRGQNFKLDRQQAGQVIILGILMSLSSLTLFESYKYLNSGIASTLLFIYPVLVAVLMIFLFHEKFSITLAVCLVIMGAGLSLLVRQESGISLDPFGCLLVMVSAMTYALYIILVNVSKTIKAIPTTKLLFYILSSGCLLFAAMIPFGHPVQTPAVGTGWINLIALAVIPTVLSLACTTIAIQLIGSTPTAIFGALEPVSALILSVTFLGQSITSRDIFGAALIVIATTLVVADKSVDKVILHVRKMFPKIRR